MSSRTALPQFRSHPMQSMKVVSCVWHELLLIASCRLPGLEWNSKGIRMLSDRSRSCQPLRHIFSSLYLRTPVAELTSCDWASSVSEWKKKLIQLFGWAWRRQRDKLCVAWKIKFHASVFTWVMLLDASLVMLTSKWESVGFGIFTLGVSCSCVPLWEMLIGMGEMPECQLLAAPVFSCV